MNVYFFPKDKNLFYIQGELHNEAIKGLSES